MKCLLSIYSDNRVYIAEQVVTRYIRSVLQLDGVVGEGTCECWC